MTREYPLSIVQENSLLRKRAKGNIFPLDYFSAIDLHIEGAAAEVVRSQLRDVLSEHEALRTRIRVRDEVLVQGVVEEPPEVLLAPAGPTAPSDLGSATDSPLVRAYVWPASDGAVRAKIWTEHTVTDGESLALIAGELARRVGAVDAPPLEPSSYGEWAARQREFLATNRGMRAIAAWRDVLGSPGTFPDHPIWASDHEQPSRSESEVIHQAADCPSGALRDELRRRRVTPTAFGMAVLAFAMRRSADALVVHTPFVNRVGPMRATIGWLAHGLPVRIPTAATMDDQLAVARSALTRSLEIGAVPLPLITRTHFPDHSGTALGRRRPRFYVDVYDPGSRWNAPGTAVHVLPRRWPQPHTEPGVSLHVRLDGPKPEFAVISPRGQVPDEALRSLMESVLLAANEIAR